VIRIIESEKRWSVSFGSLQLASSSAALLMEESGFPPVVYFPPEDVATQLMLTSETRSVCPFKGEAHYHSIEIPDLEGKPGEKDIAWYYPEVYDGVAAIAGYIAFYADRVRISD
jgi:uncharacterized protein (DUF427 family)